MLRSLSPVFTRWRLLAGGSALAFASCFGAESAAPASDDPYLWLEEISGERALRWVNEHNAATARRLTATVTHDALYRDALAVLNAASRIPSVEPHGKYLYNFWQDAAHPRGISRRATLAE
ncbi:MAG: S9 family peptidase, partial [Opitutaceae bacterium]